MAKPRGNLGGCAAALHPFQCFQNSVLSMDLRGGATPCGRRALLQAGSRPCDLRQPSVLGPADRCRAAPRCQNGNANTYSKGGSEEVVGRAVRGGGSACSD